MEKMQFEEPEMEVVRFNSQEIVTATSGTTIEKGEPIGCHGPGDAMIVG